MYRSFLSWRYLLARRTNLIGVVGIFVGVAALILILSIMTGFLDESRSKVRGSLSDIIIQPRISARVTANTAKQAAPALDVVRADPRVHAASARLAWFGLLSQGAGRGGVASALVPSPQLTNQMGVRIYGVDVATRERIAARGLTVIWRQLFGVTVAPVLHDELDTTELRAALENVSAPDRLFLRVDDPADPFAPLAGYEPQGRRLASVVLGEQLAARHFLFKGDTVTLTTAVSDPETGDIQPANRDFIVAGTFRTGENEADAGLIYMQRSELADFLQIDRDFSEILVQLNDYERDGAAARKALGDALEAHPTTGGDVERLWYVNTWEEFRGMLLGAIENERTLMAIMLSLVLVVAGFTIFAILSMMVSEKRRDIGILCAMGATRRGVLQLFLLIAFWDALVGTTLGAIAGIWGALKIDAIEVWLSSTFGIEIFNRDVYYFDHIPSRVEPLAVTAIVSGAFLCSLLFAMLPAWRAARLDPLEALRYE